MPEQSDAAEPEKENPQSGEGQDASHISDKLWENMARSARERQRREFLRRLRFWTGVALIGRLLDPTPTGIYVRESAHPRLRIWQDNVRQLLSWPSISALMPTFLSRLALGSFLLTPIFAGVYVAMAKEALRIVPRLDTAFLSAVYPFPVQMLCTFGAGTCALLAYGLFRWCCPEPVQLFLGKTARGNRTSTQLAVRTVLLVEDYLNGLVRTRPVEAVSDIERLYRGRPHDISVMTRLLELPGGLTLTGFSPEGRIQVEQLLWELARARQVALFIETEGRRYERVRGTSMLFEPSLMPILQVPMVEQYFGVTPVPSTQGAASPTAHPEHAQGAVDLSREQTRGEAPKRGDMILCWLTPQAKLQEDLPLKFQIVEDLYIERWIGEETLETTLKVISEWQGAARPLRRVITLSLLAMAYLLTFAFVCRQFVPIVKLVRTSVRWSDFFSFR